jgi:5,10-methylene-tetrahydrofolate dehydrogenase/methenyl tetrahydrofolate cyclohydrolase
MSTTTTTNSPLIIDGKATAATIQEELKEEVERLQQDHHLLPGLAVVLVGQRVDSATYVRMKKRTAAAIGIHSVDVDLDEMVTQVELLEEIEKLNQDPNVHGILVQLPLPDHIDESTILKAISVEKDADGFSAWNIGNLCLRGGDPPLAVPCTPAGVIELLQRYDIEISGKECVILGRSNIVGMPVAALLQSCNGTVTVCHSRTPNIQEYVSRADILVAAIGNAEYVKGDWLKPGAVVMDVGINSKEDATKKRGYRLVGDVDFESCSKVASAMTPVPGGVGPMTIVMLLKNTINLARHSIGLPRMPLRNALHRNLSHRDFISTTTTAASPAQATTTAGDTKT